MPRSHRLIPPNEGKIFIHLRPDNSSSWEENYPLNKTPAPKSMPSDCSLETTSSPKANSGTTWEDSSRPRAPKDKSSQSTKSTKEDQTMSRLSVSSLSINQEQESTTCTKNTETWAWMEPSVNCIKKWPVTTEPHPIPFQLSEQSFLTQRTRSEDQNRTCSERTVWDSQFWELLTEPVKTDTKRSSRPTDQTLLSNEYDKE